MASFAERIGKRAARAITQTDELDGETRTEVWNTFVVLRDVLHEAGRRSNWDNNTGKHLLEAIWTWEFKQARDEMKGEDQVWGMIKSRVLEGEWYDVLDLIEETVKYLKRYEESYTRDLDMTFSKAFNNRFEHFLVGYRFIGHEVTEIDSTAQAESVVAATESATSIAGARHHLERATELLADREKPDYPNSTKESISAVEAVVKKLTGKGELSKGLGQLEAAGLTIHPALKAAWIKMYGWTSADDGIRHGSIEVADTDQALAKYVLVTCSAFVSYLIEQGGKAGLLK